MIGAASLLEPLDSTPPSCPVLMGPYLYGPNLAHAFEFRGNYRYASLNNHFGLRSSPTSDISGLFYLMLRPHDAAYGPSSGFNWNDMDSEPAAFRAKVSHALLNPPLLHLLSCDQFSSATSTHRDALWAEIRALCSHSPASTFVSPSRNNKSTPLTATSPVAVTTAV